MNLNLRRAAFRLSPVLAVLVAGGTAAAVHSAGPVASATTPALSFVVLGSTQNVTRYEKEPVYVFGLGQYAIANQNVEIRTHKGKSYADPVKTTLSIDGGSTNLPDGITASPNRLTKFFDVRVSNSAGKTVRSAALDFCPSSWMRSRVKVDAPAESPYPRECGDHPFAVGSVFGVTSGWSVPALGDYDSPIWFQGPDGTYQVKVAVSKAWRQALGLTLGQGTMQSTVKVKTAPTPVESATPEAESATQPAMHHSAHSEHGAMAGDPLSPQMKAIHAAREQALGVPNVPAKSAPSDERPLKRLALEEVPKADLRSLPAYQIRAEVQGRKDGPKKTYLNFGATVWNAGPSPLVVDGFRAKGEDVLDAYQYFFDADGNQVGYTRAGEMEWDPRNGHNHWHFKDFASYRLLDSTKKKAIVSGKEAFCLAPTDPVDLSVKSAEWLPASTDLDTACGQGNKNLLSIREVLGTGWGDTYSQDLPGQSFNITRVPSGTYYIQTIANPDRRLTESNYDNNSALRRVKIGGAVGGKRTVKVYPYQGIKD